VVENKISQFDLTIDAFEREGEIYFKLEYCTALFTHETVRRLARHFVNIINEVGSEPGVRLADIDLMTEEEKRQVLVEFNDTDAGYPADKILHELFIEQAERTPDHTALAGMAHRRGDRGQGEMGMGYITYRELMKNPANWPITCMMKDIFVPGRWWD